MRYKMYQDAKREWRWRLKASNGRIISVSSEGYINRTDCRHSIELNKSSKNAPVDED